MTLLQSTGDWSGYPSDTYGIPGTVGYGHYSVSGSQSYQFIATQTGNYLLKFSTSTTNTFNYTFRSSALLSAGASSTPIPIPTAVPTPTQTSSSQINSPTESSPTPTSISTSNLQSNHKSARCIHQLRLTTSQFE